MESSSQNSNPVRVLIAEDNDDLRLVMPELLNGTDGFCCAATTAYLDEIAPLIARHGVEVAVLDIELRGGSALKRLPALCTEFPGTRFVIHSGHSNPELVRRAQAAGAAAFVLKSGDFDSLIETIRGVAA